MRQFPRKRILDILIPVCVLIAVQGLVGGWLDAQITKSSSAAYDQGRVDGILALAPAISSTPIETRAPDVIVVDDARVRATPVAAVAPTSPYPPRRRVPRIGEADSFAVAMYVDRRIAEPSDVLTYYVAVDNNSLRERLFQIASHIPAGTRAYCDGAAASLTLRPGSDLNEFGAGCVALPPPDPDQHGVTGNLLIPAGARRVAVFSVQVLETAQTGDKITNHGHAANQGTSQRSNGVETRVHVPHGDPV